MTQQPRWPKGSPGGGHAPGPGPGRFRPGDWVDQLSGRLASEIYRPVWWEDVQVAGHGVSETHREGGQGRYLADWENHAEPVEQMQSAGYTSEQHDALLAWQQETEIPDKLQAALRRRHRLGKVQYDAGLVLDPVTGRPIVDVTELEGVDSAGQPYRTRHHEPRRARGTVDLQDLADNLRAAIDRGRLTSNAELWRGVHLPDLKKWQPGATVTERGFMAVSMSREHAEEMLGMREDGARGRPYLLRLLAPAGTHVAAGAGAVSELLLRDGRRMRVIDSTPPTEDAWGGSPGVITVELLP